MLHDLKANKGARVRFLPVGQGLEQFSGNACPYPRAAPLAILDSPVYSPSEVPRMRLTSSPDSNQMIGGNPAGAPSDL